MAEPKGGPLASRIDHLFKAVRPKGREYSYDEVARGCEALTSGTFSKTYVWQLRTGQRDNPTKRHLEALAAFFGVPVAYFFDDQVVDDVNSQLALAAALRDSDVRDIALRALHMDTATRQSLARIVHEISRMQQSRPDPADPDSGPDAQT
ncbi:helix-turn-helix domain-containing protein [Plantactinospora endophytica]|uniref:XRE family transcriptional regulator n=1 Tax=Plantactinospora endophytica TaxID=673535 RepID=A0ABQ4ED31_9ACTN|nr:helix-turn-helix domain-containing protein [Plantactinospora endophytica]GIG92147.1 XRE family transcriptional regulator [Plantactinospora endophytica]